MNDPDPREHARSARDMPLSLSWSTAPTCMESLIVWLATSWAIMHGCEYVIHNHVVHSNENEGVVRFPTTESHALFEARQKIHVHVSIRRRHAVTEICTSNWSKFSPQNVACIFSATIARGATAPGACGQFVVSGNQSAPKPLDRG